MGRIQVLDPQVAAKIAAGEVINRPAAVVKELVENSLDAGARAITVELAEGGRRRLLVVDDGWGMTPGEAPLSLERHATSKLAEEQDLLRIATLGFRGEALPSIAAVARLELITRAPAEPMGCRVVAVAGELLEVSPWAAPRGTRVEVTDLFFNTPARRKFLKSPETEQAYILETLRRLALGYPEVHFLLRTPHKTLLGVPGPQTLPERAAALYGADLAARLVPLFLASGPWQVSGLISPADFSLASSRFQVFLVNRRVVQDRVLGAVLKEAFQGLLPRGRHPGAVVQLTLPPQEVDVNVHPAKAEVRFKEPGRVYAVLLSALREALGPWSGAGPRYTVSWQPASLTQVQETAAVPSAPWVAPRSPSIPASATAPDPAPLPPPPRPVAWRFQELDLIGQLAQSYILAQAPQGLILIDQHAAHERVLYEALADRQLPRQTLLFPRLLEVNPAQAEWVTEHLTDLAQAGLEMAPFGGAAFLLTAAPAEVPQDRLEAAVLELVEALAPQKSHAAPEAVLEQARLLLACHGAIKAGQALKREEMAALLAQLDELQVSSHCPHGRPLWRLIAYEDIRLGFRRGRG